MEEILAFLEREPVDGADDPGRVYLVCYQVLERAGDERAAAVLANGRQFLQERAARIQDNALRQGLLDNVPSHKALF